MKTNRIFTILTVGALAFFASCGGPSNNSQSTDKESSQVAEQQTPQEEVKPAQSTDLASQLQTGEKIYKEKCIVCHQADANGVKGAFPPLKNSDYLQADLKRAVAQALNGSNHEITVNGEKFNAPMTPQVKTHEDAVAVINYVLKTFNGYPDDKLVKLEDVKDVPINPAQ
jgi:mono/diheme cytochrome c family protein